MSFWGDFFVRNKKYETFEAATREMMPQGVQKWEVEDLLNRKKSPLSELADELHLNNLFKKLDNELKEKRRQRIKNPQSIYLRKKK